MHGPDGRSVAQPIPMVSARCATNQMGQASAIEVVTGRPPHRPGRSQGYDQRLLCGSTRHWAINLETPDEL
jgi:hypothetical protein